MTKIAIEKLEKALSDENTKLQEDRNHVVRLKQELTAYEASVRTREGNIIGIKHAIETLRTLS